MARADEDPRGRREPLARGGQETLGLGLDRVLERAAVHLDGVRRARQRAREDQRAHHEVVGERQLGARQRLDLGNRGHVGLDVAADLGVAAAGEGTGFEALVAVGDINGQKPADVGAVDGAAAAGGRAALNRRPERARPRRAQLAHAQFARVPVPGRGRERQALGVALLGEQMDLVPEPGQRLRETRVVDVGAGSLEQVAVEDEHARHGAGAYPRPLLRAGRAAPLRPAPGARAASKAATGFARVSRLVTGTQRYRLRNRASGREVVFEAQPGRIYRDRETDEPLEVVGRELPLAPSGSRLPWAVENLRFCSWCGPARPEGPERLPHLRQAHGTVVRARPAIAALAALLAALALSACGGASVSETPPKSTPEITPPADNSAERAQSSTTSTTKKKTTGATGESEGSEAGGGEAETGSGESSSGESSSSESGASSESSPSGGATAGGSEKTGGETESKGESSSPSGGASAP